MHEEPVFSDKIGVRVGHGQIEVGCSSTGTAATGADPDDKATRGCAGPSRARSLAAHPVPAVLDPEAVVRRGAGPRGQSCSAMSRSALFRNTAVTGRAHTVRPSLLKESTSSPSWMLRSASGRPAWRRASRPGSKGSAAG